MDEQTSAIVQGSAANVPGNGAKNGHPVEARRPDGKFAKGYRGGRGGGDPVLKYINRCRKAICRSASPADAIEIFDEMRLIALNRNADGSEADHTGKERIAAATLWLAYAAGKPDSAAITSGLAKTTQFTFILGESKAADQARKLAENLAGSGLAQVDEGQ